MSVYVSEHFIQRAQERLGYDRDRAMALGHILFRLIDTGQDRNIRFVARVSRDGKRIFQFTAKGARPFYALLDTEARACVTILPPGFVIGREGKTPMQLKENDR